MERRRTLLVHDSISIFLDIDRANSNSRGPGGFPKSRPIQPTVPPSAFPPLPDSPNLPPPPSFFLRPPDDGRPPPSLPFYPYVVVLRRDVRFLPPSKSNAAAVTACFPFPLPGARRRRRRCVAVLPRATGLAHLLLLRPPSHGRKKTGRGA